MLFATLVPSCIGSPSSLPDMQAALGNRNRHVDGAERQEGGRPVFGTKVVGAKLGPGPSSVCVSSIGKLTLWYSVTSVSHNLMRVFEQDESGL